MPDNENNQQNNDSTQGSGGSHIFAVGMDTNQSSDMDNLNKIKETLESCGNKAYLTQIGSNQETYLPRTYQKLINGVRENGELTHSLTGSFNRPVTGCIPVSRKISSGNNVAAIPPTVILLIESTNVFA